MMTLGLVIALALGVVFGRLDLLPVDQFPDSAVNIVLCFLVAAAGFMLASDDAFSRAMKQMRGSVLLVPLFAGIGSLAGGLLASAVTGVDLRAGLGIAGGFGWYTLSGLLVNGYAGAEAGALAFLANLFREILALLLIPLVMRRPGGYFAAGMAGATAMDTTLPLLAEYGDPERTMTAFLSGVILSLAVPLWIPLVYGLMA